MRVNAQDETLKRNYVQKYRFLIGEYEQVKAKRHPKFRFVKEFYAFHDTDPRSFLKYYHRWRQSGREKDLLYETTFASVDELKDEPLQYLVYYNHERPHQALNGQTPAAFNEKCPRIT